MILNFIGGYMKKIIFLLCFTMFMCVNAKHYNKNDKNPNATVFVKLNYIKVKGSRAKKGTTEILQVDDLYLNKGAFLVHNRYQSIRLEPGVHEITLHIYLNSLKETIVTGTKEAKPVLKYEFEADKTYYIDVYTEKERSIYAKIREEGEPVTIPEIQ